MQQITAGQMATLSCHAFERYLDRLVSTIRLRVAEHDLPPGRPDDTPSVRLRELAKGLVRRAADVGLTAEGDVTPFCLLVLNRDAAFRGSALYPWITAVIQAVEHPARERMDTVYQLLAPSVRDYAFSAADGSA